RASDTRDIGVAGDLCDIAHGASQRTRRLVQRILQRRRPPIAGSVGDLTPFCFWHTSPPKGLGRSRLATSAVRHTLAMPSITKDKTDPPLPDRRIRSTPPSLRIFGQLTHQFTPDRRSRGLYVSPIAISLRLAHMASS